MSLNHEKKIFCFVILLGLCNVAFSQQLRCDYSGTQTSVEAACAEVVTGFIPHPTDCTAYVLCLLEVPRVYWCDVSIPVFDRLKCNCVEGDPFTCTAFETSTTTVTSTDASTGVTLSTEELTETTTKVKESTTTEQSTEPTTSEQTTEPTTSDEPTDGSSTTSGEETTTTPPQDNVCFGINSGYVAHPTICYLYYWCLLGIANLQECPEDRIFVPPPMAPGCALGDRETCEFTMFD